MRLLLSLFLLLTTFSFPGATELTSADTTQAPICHAEAKPDEAGPAHMILAGYGAQHMPLASKDAQAQAFFDNGLQLAHAFAHAAAISAFQRAELIDPTCAMCAWGESWVARSHHQLSD